MASPLLPPVYIPGFSFVSPFYSRVDGALEGICGSETDIRKINELLSQYADKHSLVYIVEASSLYLIGSSIGEHSTYNAESIVYNVTDAKNPIIRNTASELLFTDSTFKPDGSYTMDISGETYCFELLSFSDSISYTLDWKIVAVDNSEGCEEVKSYERTIAQASRYMRHDVQSIFDGMAYIPAAIDFLSGSMVTSPLSTTTIAMHPEPGEEGQGTTTQQSLWLLMKAFEDNNALVEYLTTLFIVPYSCAVYY
jgi:hypothetical protein